MGFFDDQVLLTLGARWQRVQVDDWTDNVKGDTAYDEEKVSPSGGILFKATDKLSLYANYMEGLSQGKIAPSTSKNEDQIFPPFISRQMEVGAKYDAGSYALTAAVFRIKQPAYETNATTRVFGPNGKRENNGVELSVFGEPLKGFRLLGGVMYIDSELTHTTNGTFDGNRAPATPKYNANLGAELTALAQRIPLQADRPAARLQLGLRPDGPVLALLPGQVSLATLGDHEAVLDCLSEERSVYSPLHLDANVLEDHDLALVLPHGQPQSLQVFYRVHDDWADVYILDEFNALWQQRLDDEPTTAVQNRYDSRHRLSVSAELEF
mgnify:CR=1 FL=1